MVKKILFVFCLAAVFCTCKKNEPVKPLINYMLGGFYVRDTNNTNNGLKILNLSNENYCWTTVIFGNDSSFCNGTWKQTSDSTLLWNNGTVIHFIITRVDSIPKGINLQIRGNNFDTSVLSGYYYE
ncbi:MAG: hypothetical protein H7296_01230 [Bacteroidia bacterium]|nr:hypothetical protein [Bacteroidia bacterium]